MYTKTGLALLILVFLTIAVSCNPHTEKIKVKPEKHDKQIKENAKKLNMHERERHQKKCIEDKLSQWMKDRMKRHNFNAHGDKAVLGNSFGLPATRLANPRPSAKFARHHINQAVAEAN